MTGHLPPIGFGPPPRAALRFKADGSPLFWMEPQGHMPFDRTPIFTVRMADPNSERVLVGQASHDDAVVVVKALRAYYQGRGS